MTDTRETLIANVLKQVYDKPNVETWYQEAGKSQLSEGPSSLHLRYRSTFNSADLANSYMSFMNAHVSAQSRKTRQILATLSTAVVNCYSICYMKKPSRSFTFLRFLSGLLDHLKLDEQQLKWNDSLPSPSRSQ